MESNIQRFIADAIQTWNLTLSDTIDANQSIQCLGSTDWCTLFRAQHVSASDIRSLFRSCDNAILIDFRDHLADIYAKSPLDESHICAPDIDLRSQDLWSLPQNYFAFTFELDRKFGCRKLESQFVHDFKIQYKCLAKNWRGDLSHEQRSHLSLLTLLRLFFTAFLSERGELDKRRHFLIQEADKCVQKNQSIYQEFIRPLFFESLNRPPARRTKRAQKLGALPFLNGGLFTPTDLERSLPNLDAPNDVWIKIFDTLFERYRFNAYPHHSTCNNALDPWMLGHIFETLMTPENRTSTGSFYTPIPLAQNIVRQTLCLWLEHHTNLSFENAEKLCSDSDFPDISPSLAQDIEQKLATITILDPTSGSGSFLQSALRYLHHIRTKLHAFLHHPIHPGFLAKQILTANLFGIDILPTANQICELRLWLELIRYYPPNEPLPPLPNLDLNILCGNTLLDLHQLSAFLGLPPETPPPDYAHLKRRYKTATGTTKKRLANQIQHVNFLASQRLISRLESSYQIETHAIRQAASALPFSSAHLTSAQSARLKSLQTQQQYLEEGKKQETCFSFDIHFSEIAQKGGFHIVIGNPPWFSLHTLPAHLKDTLHALYQTAVSAKVEKCTQSADISALFVEKSLRCVQKHGLVAMLLPNKLFSAPSYENFRQHIHTHAQPLHFTDWTHSAHNAFRAATYPACVILKQTDSHDDFRNAPILPTRAKLASQLTTPHFDYPIKLKDKFHLRRGICTGANHLFVGEKRPDALSPPNADTRLLKFNVDGETRVAPIESELLHDTLRGADIRAFHVQTPNAIILTHKPHLITQPLPHLPHHALSWFSPFQTRLEERKSAAGKIFYALSTIPADILSPKVVWRDIAFHLEACFLPDAQILPINTAYYLPVQSLDEGYLAAAWLNTTKVRQFCRARAEHAENDYRRYLSWVLSDIPWFFDDVACAPWISSIIVLSKRAHRSTPQEAEKLRQQMDELFDHCIHACAHSRPANPSLPL